MMAIPLLLAAASGAAERGESASLRLLDLPPAWVVVLVVLPLLAGAAWIGYARQGVAPRARWVLGGLRFAALVVLFLVLARPVLVERREEVHPAEVVVLLDDSASMRREDVYADPALRESLASATGVPGGRGSRLDLARGGLERTLLPVLRRGDYEVSLYGFGERATPLASPADATGRSSGTHLGDAVSQVLSARRGRFVTDVVVLSDGRQNGGLALSEAARLAGTAGVPVHTVLVGDERPEHNAVVELVEAPTGVLEGDEVAVTVRVTGRGTDGLASAPVVLEELDPRGAGGRGRVHAEQEVALSEQGERVVLVAPPEEGAGERRFRASVPPLPGETMVDDNRVDFTVHVSKATIRVLYVEGYPRWEYRYLWQMLVRADERIEAQMYLLSADPNFPQESTRGLPSLRRVPTTRAELLDRYDVVILGDVNPYAVSSDPSASEAFLHALREFVEAGGGLLFQAGEFDDPRAYVGTPLEDLLPVVLDPSGVLALDQDTTREVRPRLEDPLNPHAVVRLHPDTATNRRLWEDETGLRGFYWFWPVERAKPGTEVLLRHPSAGNDHGRFPLLVAGYYPSGRTMFLALDSTWMWRYHYGPRYRERFWRNAIRWLALGRLKSGDRRYQLETTRSSYPLDERVVLEARVLDEDFRPSERPSLSVHWSGPEGGGSEVVLEAEPGRAGVFRGTLQVDRPGLYRAWIEGPDGGERLATAEFEVELPSRENADPSPDPAALRELARATGGRALQLAEISELSAELPGGEERREPISSRLDDAWDHWATMALALGLLSAEWILRKRAELL